jgi:uncharacterized membrane protein HdeD (DUF308 family)
MNHPVQGVDEVTSFPLVDRETVRAGRGWFVALGVSFLVLGVLAIALPLVASLVTTVLIGWLLVVGGVIQGVHAIQNRRWAGSGWALVGAAVLVVAGALVAIFPVVGTLTLTLVLAAFFVAEGLLKMIRAAQHRTLPGWRWLLCDGILSLLLGGLILFQWPSAAVWALGLLVGVNFIFGGSSMLLIGLGAGSMAPARR